MQTGLTETQRAFQETARRFARERIAPGYMTREQDGRVDRALIRDMGALGLLGADVPEQFGGMGEASVTVGLIMEAIGYADINVGYLPLLAALTGKSSPGTPRPVSPPSGCRARFRRGGLLPWTDGTARRFGCWQPRAVGAAGG